METKIEWGFMVDRWHDQKGPAHRLKPDGSPACGASYFSSAGQVFDVHESQKCKRCLRVRTVRR